MVVGIYHQRVTVDFIYFSVVTLVAVGPTQTNCSRPAGNFGLPAQPRGKVGFKGTSIRQVSLLRECLSACRTNPAMDLCRPPALWEELFGLDQDCTELVFFRSRQLTDAVI